ncbi:MAG: LysR family transcriptional regulator [Candidatus Puniceispirillaceae bacterium]
MTIRLLRTFIVVAESNSFSEAAEKIHITHAAVSQQMKQLEDSLSVELFDRSLRSPKLTAIAYQIVEKARKIVDDYDSLAKPNQGDKIFESEINLGSIPTALTGLTAQAIAAMKVKFPRMKIHVRSGLTAPLLADVGRGVLDAAIISKPHLMPTKLAFHKIADEKMQLIVSSQEAEDDPIKLLLEKPYIRFNRSEVIGTVIDNWMSSNHITVNETMEFDSGEAITSMVEAGLGVSILPEPVIMPGHAIKVKRLQLGADAPQRTLGLVYLGNNIKMQIINEMISVLSEVAKSNEVK